MITKWIPENNIAYLQTAIEKLNKKATKCNAPQIQISIHDDVRYFKMENDTMVEVNPETEKGSFVKTYRVEIEGNAPVISGWQFLARCEHTPEGNIMYVVPGMFVPDSHRKGEQKCEHCNVNRKRNDTYIVVNKESGETKQIGSSCLADFLGHKNPEAIASYASMLTLNLSEVLEISERIGGGSGKEYISLSLIVEMTSAVIKKYGWTSASKAEEFNKVATRCYVSEQIWNRHRMAYSEIINPDEDDKKQAEKAILWIKDAPETENNDYISNLKIIALNGCVSHRSFGMAVSLMASYNREMNAQKVQENKKPSEHKGAIGKREIFSNLTCDFVHSFNTDFGTQTINKMIDSEGNVFVWKSGNSLSKGKTYVLKATVKAHDEYKSKCGKFTTKQTILTRAAIIEEKEAVVS